MTSRRLRATPSERVPIATAASPTGVLFEVGRERFCTMDAIYAADLRGELAAPIRELRRGLAAVRRIEERGDSVDSEALQAAVDAWRASRDLEAAEETDAWLEARGLEIDHVVAFAEREIAAKDGEDDEGADDDAALVDAALVGAELPAHLACCGALDRHAVELARRAAVHAAWVEGGRTSPTAEEVAARAAVPRSLSLAETRGRAPLAALDGVFELRVAALLAPERIARAVENARLDLVRLDVTTASFATLDAAREAVLCVREDGDALETVARRADTVATRRAVFAGELDDALRGALLSARTKGVIGPRPESGRFAIYELERKVEPSPDDPDVRARVGRSLRERAFREELEARVRWISWQPRRG